MSRRPAVTVIGIVFTLATTCADPQPVREVPANGGFVFAGFNDGEPSELFAMDADGGGFRQLTDDGTFKTSIAGSPDGSLIAYAALSHEPTLGNPEPELGSIYVVNRDGTDRRIVCERCSATVYTELLVPGDDSVHLPMYEIRDALAWAPDGSRIAAPGSDHGVLLIDPDTGASRTIPTREPITAIAWSPDVRRLALSHTWIRTENGPAMAPSEGIQSVEYSEEPRPGGIYLMDVASGQYEEVVTSPGFAHVYGWSADGELMAYTRATDDSGSSELAVYSIKENRSWPLVTDDRAYARAAAWSPVEDNLASLILRQRVDSERESLDLLSSAGNELRELPLCAFQGAFDDDGCALPKVVWSPDGATIAYRGFIAGAPLTSVIVLQDVESDTFDVVRISGTTFYDGRVADCCMAWLPASA